MELWGPLCVLLFALGLITVVGHGIWVALAWLLGTRRRARATRARYCPQCGAPLAAEQHECNTCGWHAGLGEGAGPLADLAAARRQLERFREQGVLDEPTFHRLTAAISAERERLLAPLRTQPTAPAVAVPLVEPKPPRKLEEQPREAELIEGLTAAISSERERLVAPQRTQPPVPAVPAPPKPPPELEEEPLEVELLELAPAPRPVSLGQPQPPPPPKRKPLGELLAAFLEAKNIRWGELAGGLLIIGCSIALVISFWAEIAQRPLLKFFVFTAVTGSLFAAGLYTHRRWRLPNTSGGLLIIATLLVPLNFLAIAAFSAGAAKADAVTIGGEVVTLGLFLWLLYQAGKVLVPQWSAALAAGVLVPSSAQLLMRRFALAASDAPEWLFLMLGALPLACYVGAAGWMLRGARQWAEVKEQQANRVFVLLGAITFAALVPLGLLIYKSGDVGWALRRLAPLTGLLAVPGLGSGLFLWSRVRDRELAGVRVAGTSIAVLAALVLVAGIGLAWPTPARIVAVGLTSCAVLTAVALLFELPAAHGLALPCLVLAYLVGFHAVRDTRLGWLDETGRLTATIFSATSGTALVPMFALLTVAGELLRWFRRRLDGLFYAGVAGGVAALSLVLVTWYGFGYRRDPHGATWVYALYAGGALWIAGRLKHVAASWTGAVLLLAALVQGLAFSPVGEWLALRYPWQVALLCHATLGVIGAAAVKRLREEERTLFEWPALWCAVASSAVAATMFLPALSTETAAWLAGRTFWLAGIWLAVAWLGWLPRVFRLFQAALALGVVFAATALVERSAWYAAATYPPLLDPWTLQAQGLGLAVLALAWTLVRLGWVRVARRDPPWVAAEPVEAEAQHERGPTVFQWDLDRVLHVVVIGLVAALGLFAAVPGVVQELSPAARAAPEWAKIPHGHAIGAGSWAVLIVLLVALAVKLWERFEPWSVLAGIVALGSGCLLLAGRWEVETATASALRWAAAAYLLLGSVPIWLRRRAAAVLEGMGWRGLGNSEPGWARSLLVGLTVLPVLGITIYSAAAAIARHPAVGPAAGSFFQRAGDTISYAVPLLAVSTALVGHALRERSAQYAFSAGLVLNLTVSLAHLLAVVTSGRQMGAAEWILLGQYNAATAAGFALAWVAVRWWQARMVQGAAPAAPGILLCVQGLMGAAVVAMVLVPVAGYIALNAADPAPRELAAAGGGWGWVAFGLSAAAVGWLAGWRRWFPADLICLGVVAAAALLASALWEYDLGDWRAYHALLVGSAAAAWVTFGSGWAAGIPLQRGGVRRWVSAWCTVAAVLAVLLALRECVSHTAGVYWTVATLAAAGCLAWALAAWTPGRGFVYAAGATWSLAATVWWMTEQWQWELEAFVGWVALCAIVLAVAAIGSIVIELRVLRRESTRAFGLPAFHHLAVVVSLLAVAGMVGLGLAADLSEEPLAVNLWLCWGALVATAVLIVACFWDVEAKYAVACLYVVGLAAVGMTLDGLDLEPDLIRWSGTLVLGAYTLLASYLWSVRRGLVQCAEVLGVPVRGRLESVVESPSGTGRSPLAAEAPLRQPPLAPPLPRGEAVEGLVWLVPVTLALASTVIALALWAVLTMEEFTLRSSAASAAVAQAFAVGLLAKGTRRGLLQQTALLLAVVGVVAWGWAWLEPGGSGTLLNRAVVVMVTVAAMTAFYAVGMGKLLRRETEWTRGARQAVPWLIAAGGASLAFILTIEVTDYARARVVLMDAPAIVAVAVALVGLCWAALVLALVPGRDPLNLSEQGRMHYVYGAEIFLGLLFLHLKLTVPWLFRVPVFQYYWPLTVMLLAFVGIGLGELFRRQGRMVLAAPLERTAAFLPLLPVLVYWTAPSDVHYSVLLLVVASLYAAQSLMRRSFAFGVLSALSANGALWYLLHRSEGLGLLEHPQLWLIPFATSVLGAAYLNRDRLSETQMTTIRYLAISVIYVSSTADIFINGVATSPWLPLVLMALSVVGVLCGIMLRVRAFLYLGTAFLVVSLVTIIWHASANLGWTWLWYVAGIVLGILIIFMFALFELKRNEVLRMVEGLKRWER